jgi:diacylglycerol kinase
MAVPYAQIVGIIVLVLGILGLFITAPTMLGVVNTDIMEDIVHLITGGLLVYVGFVRKDLASTVVLVLGIIYLIVGILGFLSATLFGLMPSGYTLWDNIIHLVLGIVGVAVARAGGTVTRTA